MSPRPCVRPGRVASITTAATTTLTQPKRIAPVSVVQRRPGVGIVEDGAGSHDPLRAILPSAFRVVRVVRGSELHSRAQPERARGTVLADEA